MKNILFTLLLSFVCCKEYNGTPAAPKNYSKYESEALSFCKSNGFNEDYFFLIDMSIHPGKNRFFVYDFKSNKFTYKKLVTHGSCDVVSENPEKWEKAKFNNANDSHCTAKGKYKIGKRDYSSWGIKVKYWLHGLEKTNANAEKRVIVLHSWDAVSDEEVYPKVSPLSWGCPAVSDAFMKVLDGKLKQTPKPVLLWIIGD
ncbi:MAG: peptidase [Flavobacterium sp. BFFFF1]|uniref:murein L,D-transpeptidase catalytic domain-containing protein n=1 Tax=unclassified Flavobacterium TaxID=196869 RepID=UPI000BC8E6A5|nr:MULTISPECIES: murein L,D-transpeptidase catalytic domain family protein [unclassified Flavobacterium]OYU80850.1 MAG: peptidase [Flavobacterium sp. BFFFF1]